MNSSNSINKIREYPNSQSANVYHSTSEQFQSAQPGVVPTGRQGPPLPPPPSSFTPAATSASVLDLDWYKTPEGQGVLTHLIDQTTGHRKIYGNCHFDTQSLYQFFVTRNFSYRSSRITQRAANDQVPQLQAVFEWEEWQREN